MSQFLRLRLRLRLIFSLRFFLSLFIILSLCSILSAQGNVGIGLTNPDHKLTILSTDSTLLRLLGPGPFQSKARITFGDISRVYIQEDFDDKMLIYGQYRIALMGGPVGIGTKSPTTNLHIFSADYPTIKLQSDGLTEESGRVSLRQSNDTGVDMYYEGVADELTFEPFTSGVGAGKKLTMNLAGNVGIGRSPGTLPLVIKGDANNGIVQFYNNADVAKWHFRLETNGALGLTESGVVDRRLVIAPGGNVGINTTMAPTATLQIFSGTEPTIKLQSDGTAENSGRISLRQSNDTGSDLYYDGILDQVVLETFTGGSTDGRRMIIKQTTGDVGIGTTILATGHKLSVNGKIACTEVRVQPLNQWPDYVFADDYALKPLGQLKEEIDAHNHLPGIPSAEEIKNNGIQVGDMQTRMMEKIEELTLYIIELNAKMEELKKVNDLQTLEIASLKKPE